MAGQAGRDVLIQISDSAEPATFETVAGLRAQTIALAAKTVDGTASDSPGAWRELLPTAGLREATVSGSGVFKDTASDELIREAFFSQTTPTLALVIPDFGTLTGPFQISALEYGGRYDAEATFSMTLSSSGAISFVSASS